ncbi:MAG: DMT family transporter [Rectinemataceae bacterium]|nr:DMT family transporter [Spirochaetaceae bacterium]
MEKLGLLAAFGTAVCWAFSAIYFETASRKSSALAINFWKVVFAFIFLGISGTVLRGVPFPWDAPPRTWLFLSLSGLVGFVVADYFLFNAYVMIGSRITVVFQSLTPVFTSALAFVFLGERMRLERLAGMVVTVGGILLVVLTRARHAQHEEQAGHANAGLLFALFAALFQAGGMVLTKAGIGTYSAVSATQIRTLVAIAGFGIQALVLGQADFVLREVPKKREAFIPGIKGAVFGPFLGVALSLFSLQHTQAGATSTLMAMTPVVIILPSVFMLKQKVHAGEILGAAIAVAGAALFFLL